VLRFSKPLTSALVLARTITTALVLSTKKSGKRGNNEINAVSNRLGEIRVGAKLLAKAYEDEGLDQPVEVSSHRLALLGQRILWSAGTVAGRRVVFSGSVNRDGKALQDATDGAGGLAGGHPSAVAEASC